MDKPRKKSLFKICNHYDGLNEIRFFSPMYLANELKEFGTVEDFRGDEYVLRVDGRYDFKEVLRYIQETYERKI